MRWGWLGIVALVAIAWTQASAGSFAKPELSDASGDTESLLPVPSREADLAAVWIDFEDKAGLHIAFAFHAFAKEEAQRTEYSVQLAHAGRGVVVGADEDGPTGAASAASWDASVLRLVVPHSKLKDAARGQELLLRDAAATSWVLGAGATTTDKTADGLVGRYVLGSQLGATDPYPPPTPSSEPASSPAPAATPPGPPPMPRTYSVNLVRAENLGCSKDTDTPPDLRFKVFANERLVLEAYADQVHAPYYAAIASIGVDPPVQIKVQALEGQPGPWFGDDSYVPCDVARGEEEVTQVSWDGSEQELDLRGDGPNAVRLQLRLGSTPPRAPLVEISADTANAAVLWDAAPSDGERIAAGHYGAVLTTLPLGSFGISWSGLCDNHPYPGFRVVRVRDGWHVAAPEVAFRTANRAPEPPVITSVREEGATRLLRFEEPTAHDIVRYGVVGWNRSAQAWVPAGELKQPALVHHQSVRVRAEADVSHYRVSAHDTEGLEGVSEPFAVGDPSKAEVRSGPAACPFPPPASGVQLLDSAGWSQQAASEPTPSGHAAQAPANAPVSGAGSQQVPASGLVLALVCLLVAAAASRRRIS